MCITTHYVKQSKYYLLAQLLDGYLMNIHMIEQQTGLDSLRLTCQKQLVRDSTIQGGGLMFNLSITIYVEVWEGVG